MKNKNVEEKLNSAPHTEPESQIEKYLSRVIPKIVDALGLEKLNYYYLNVPEGFDNDCDKNKPSDTTVFAIDYRREYKAVYLYIYPLARKFFKEGKLGTINRGLVHEMSHIVTEEICKYAESRYVSKKLVEESVEEVTERFAIMARELLTLKGSGEIVF